MILRRIAFRLVSGFATLIVVGLVVFMATNILPGDAARIVLGISATEEAIAKFRAEMGLDRSLAGQLFGWLSNIARLDFGTSLITREPVAAMILPRLANTALLLLSTALVALPLSVALGVAMGIRPYGRFDGVMNTVMIFIAGIPEFVIAILLVLIFSTGLLHLLPPTTALPVGETIWQNPQVLVLPVLTLAIAILPYLSRLVRGSMIEAMGSEYVAVARLKGVPEHQVVLRHALRNSLAPAIQASALSLAFILGGSVVIEFLFEYPGLGSMLQRAVAQRDIFLIQAVVLIFSGSFILFNIMADILMMLVTPRLRSAK